MANKFGIHVSNEPIDYADLDRMIGVGCDNYVLLHHQADYLPRLRQSTNGVILVRYYDTKLLEKNPVEFAGEVATEAFKYEPYTHHLVFDNELNLDYEGGQNYDNVQYVAKWKTIVAAELKRLCPWLQIHAGPFAPVADWWNYFVAMLAYQDSYDIIDVHAYGTFRKMKAIVEAVKSQTNKPLFISECNGPGTLEFMRWAQSQPYVLAACYFIWHWHNPDMPEWDKDLRSSALETQIKEIVKEDTVMGLVEQFPAQFEEWEAAGGIENNFRSHLLAVGALQPTKADLLGLIDEAKSKNEQVRLVAQALPLA
ncbi:MAG: glycosyl hydrolase [Chloroflexi bacterium]|nr:glycosyl hydrolase [Chloroflexota bacterium]MDA8187153.1 glycosyl hydrolase [Dehalococcoidales bacterium]